MPDTAENTQAAGQPEASADDTAAQQMLADAMQNNGGGGNEPDPWDDEVEPQAGSTSQPSGKKAAADDPWADPDAARKEIEKLRKESAKYRTQLREAEPQLKEYQAYLDSQKTEQEKQAEAQQKLAEEKAATERELTSLKSANARLMAAATHDLPADLIDVLGEGTEEEISARAELIAKVIADTVAAAVANAAPPPPEEDPATRGFTSTRPVESLIAGGQPASQPPADMDSVLRRWAGRT